MWKGKLSRFIYHGTSSVVFYNCNFSSKFDNYVLAPAIIASEIPWVRLRSANPMEINPGQESSELPFHPSSPNNNIIRLEVKFVNIVVFIL